MQDINNCIKENDTDNVILNKLKELGTKLTGQENVQGETVAEVLEFINTNYSGGGSGSNIILYLKAPEYSSEYILDACLVIIISTIVNFSCPVSE